MPVTLTVHDSQYPARLAAQLQRGLRCRQLPGKFLYDSPAQAQRWLAYHRAYAPWRTAAEAHAFYAQGFGAARQRLGGGALHYVSLGCGDGSKDALGLEILFPQCRPLHLTLLDSSVALVIEAVLRLRQDSPDVSLFPLVADVEAVPELAALLAAQAPPAGRRLLACFGLLPNLDYGTFLPALRRLLRPGDWLLLSANLSPQPYPDACPAILPQYDNPLAHAWFLGLLDSLGVPPRHAELRVTAQPLRVDGHIWQIRAVAVFCRPTTLTLYGESFAFAAGERVQLFFSTRFTPEAVPEVLAAAGLPVVAAWVFAGQEEGLYLCTPG